jgi:hypothetical protein
MDCWIAGTPAFAGAGKPRDDTECELGEAVDAAIASLPGAS